ncbi:hypothetical protein [Gracilibacillus xinjiangensis]|uniref:Uncharacterized protein n=1 Tax=Gracilibacillus xinjiangensis TaxID=1193282 RepID=A0ABV8WY74_9BACI
MPYEMTEWVDDIVDPTNGEVLQEGTRYTAARANHFEKGIYDAHEKNDEQDNQIRRIQALLEIDGRVPGNSGAFYDLLEGSFSRAIRQTNTAILLNSITAGATQIDVDDGLAFEDNTQVTIYDNENIEDVIVSSVDGDTLSVQPLVNSYKKGARIERSNVKVGNGLMTFGTWGTYTISEVIE